MKYDGISLTAEETAILEGGQGETMRKALESIIKYGRTFGATSLVPIDHPVHLVTSFGVPMLRPVYSLMDQLISAGLKTSHPFTVDPRPMDFRNVSCSFLEKIVFRKIMYGAQSTYEGQLAQVGLKDDDAFTCTCYMDEVGNIPEKGQYLAWAESSAVVYANSVLGARTNRNSGILELLCGITGRAPLFGFLTDEGRMASWVVEVKTSTLPEAQILGSAIGMKVMEDVPYIRGLDTFLGSELTQKNRDYLKDMGAATASNGAVGLYHVENLTPEAGELKDSLIRADHRTYVVDDRELERIKKGYPVMWKNRDAQPARCFIGCPHLSKRQIYEWLDRIGAELDSRKQDHVKVDTVLTAAPQVADSFRNDEEAFSRLKRAGLHLSSICPLMYMNNPLCAKKAIITNSNKLRTYSTARYYTDAEITKIVVKGRADV